MKDRRRRRRRRRQDSATAPFAFVRPHHHERNADKSTRPSRGDEATGATEAMRTGGLSGTRQKSELRRRRREKEKKKKRKTRFLAGKTLQRDRKRKKRKRGEEEKEWNAAIEKNEYLFNLLLYLR